MRDLTDGRGSDSVIDAVGMESHGLSVDNLVDTVKAHTFLGTDRPHALRQAILACRKSGTVSVPGVYAGFLDKVVAAEELQGAALAAARQLKKINMTAHKNTKLKVRKALLETLDNAIIQDQEHLG